MIPLKKEKKDYDQYDQWLEEDVMKYKMFLSWPYYPVKATSFDWENELL